MGEVQALTDEHGGSRITYPDYALAMVDELERINAVGRRIMVAH